MNEFYVVDVETANADYSSICQIGFAKFFNGKLVDTWKTLVNPEDYFDEMNISIHGITEEVVKDAPVFSEIYETIKIKIENNIVVHHMPFDRIAINRACELNSLRIIQAKWLDSAKVVRRTWTEFAHSGYGLSNVADFLNINFDHHDALEDAIATGKVMVKAISESRLNITDWLDRVQEPINIYIDNSPQLKIKGDPNGPLYGEKIVFTGSLSMTRDEAAKLVAKLGADVSNSVTKKTTMLVVGIQDDYKLSGYLKSSKHRKAEDLIAKGIKLRILSEDDFKELLKVYF